MRGIAALPGLIRLYLWNCGLDISRSMAYRFNFIAGTLISLLSSGVAPIVQYLIFTTTNGYPGWTVKQLILFQGVMLLWGGLRSMLFGRVFTEAMSLVRNGDFDRLLVKPYPPIGVLLSSGFQLNGIGPTLGGVVIIILAANALDAPMYWWTLPLFLAMLVFGILLLVSLLILLCSVVIMLVQMGRMGDLFQKITSFADYPMNIYPKSLKQFFSIFLPFALWINFPAEVLLARLDMMMVWGAIASVVLLYLSNWVWNLCLSKYSSAGG